VNTFFKRLFIYKHYCHSVAFIAELAAPALPEIPMPVGKSLLILIVILY